MTYAQFASDLPPGRTTTFRSAEENEEAMQRLGVHQQIRQVGKGPFRADLGVESVGEVALYSDRFSTAFTMALEPPADYVGLLFLRAHRERVLVCGEEVAGDKLVVLPPGSALDITGPDLTASDTIGIPKARFEHLTEALRPGPRPAWPQGTAVIPGDTEKLEVLRQTAVNLLGHPEQDPRHELSERLVTEAVAWIGDSLPHPSPEGSGVNGGRARVAKRAQEFLEEHYWDSIAMEDLCQNAGVGIRTLQRCFREYFDLTITDYLKTLRLNAARRHLTAAEPSETSVTTVALEHGFGHLGRFSVEFRDRFGESPSETLARAPGRAA